MKRILCLVLALMVMACCFTACATKLSGTYVADGLIQQKLTFKDDNVVSLSAFGLDVEGTYVIEDGKMIITYTLLGQDLDMEKTFEKDGDTLIIDGTEFTKE